MLSCDFLYLSILFVVLWNRIEFYSRDDVEEREFGVGFYYCVGGFVIGLLILNIDLLFYEVVKSIMILFVVIDFDYYLLCILEI